MLIRENPIEFANRVRKGLDDRGAPPRVKSVINAEERTSLLPEGMSIKHKTRDIYKPPLYSIKPPKRNKGGISSQ